MTKLIKYYCKTVCADFITLEHLQVMEELITVAVLRGWEILTFEDMLETGTLWADSESIVYVFTSKRE